VHAKAKKALTDVIDPSIFDVPDGHVPKHFNGSLPSSASDGSISNRKVTKP